MAATTIQNTLPSYYVTVVTEYTSNTTYLLQADTEKNAKEEAMQYLADIPIGEGHVEVYKDAGGPNGVPLLIWIGSI